MTRAMAIELAPRNVRVNAFVRPMDTDSCASAVPAATRRLTYYAAFRASSLGRSLVPRRSPALGVCLPRRSCLHDGRAIAMMRQHGRKDMMRAFSGKGSWSPFRRAVSDVQRRNAFAEQEASVIVLDFA